MEALERKARMLRQLDIIDVDALGELQVTLIGAGGIGSFVGQYLAKMGVRKLTVYDPDIVEEHNLSNQLYGQDAIGASKVKALAAEIERFGDPEVDVTIWEEPVRTDTKLTGVVICSVDSLTARREIWQAVKMNLDVDVFIDARMGAEIGQVRVVTPSSPDGIRSFEASLDGLPVELPCTAKATVYNGAGIASLVVNQVKRFANGEPTQSEVVLSYPDLESGSLGFVTL